MFPAFGCVGADYEEVRLLRDGAARAATRDYLGFTVLSLPELHVPVKQYRRS